MQFNMSDGEVFNANPTTALVFLDETGTESLTDPEFPVFGFGGCCVLARNYYEYIRFPWNKVKKERLGLNNGIPFHSNEIRLNDEQENVMQRFFNNKFGRFSVIVSKAHINESNKAIEEILYFNVHQRIIEILKWTEFTDVLLIYEHSRRLVKKIEPLLSTIKITSQNTHGDDEDIPLKPCVMLKSTAEPGLEVADFIIHSVGQAVRDRYLGRIEQFMDNKRCSYMFGDCNDKLCSFLYVNSITFTQSEQEF